MCLVKEHRRIVRTWDIRKDSVPAFTVLFAEANERNVHTVIELLSASQKRGCVNAAACTMADMNRQLQVAEINVPQRS